MHQIVDSFYRFVSMQRSEMHTLRRTVGFLDTESAHLHDNTKMLPLRHTIFLSFMEYTLFFFASHAWYLVSILPYQLYV